MTAIELAKQAGFDIKVEGNGDKRTISGIYCGDLLSMVMGRAKADDAWITVMGNINSVAVGVLADVTCIILAEEITMNEQALQKAADEGVCIIHSHLPTFETAKKIAELAAL
ncbi:MAG: hypothetical protein K0R90_338 [Oscillospiraceae bacterium]|jgi:hypothetical protein|nr:hypothetical protein [Oscillospiraceae bacterium]